MSTLARKPPGLDDPSGRRGAQGDTGMGKRGIGKGWRWLAVVLLAPWVCLAQPVAPLSIDATESHVPLGAHTRYLHDGGGIASVEQARRALAEGRFVPLPNGDASFGFQTGAFWFHARVVNHNPDEQRWLLVQQYALSDRIDIYLRYPDGREVHHAGGDTFPFEQRSIRYRHPNFWVDLPAGTPVDLLVRVQSQSSMQVPLFLYTPAAFAELSRDGQLSIGLYYGILLALFFYNLVLWLVLRDGSYFWYLFHISAFGLVLFTLNGLGFEYLWPHSTWLADKGVPLSVCLAQIGMQQFARTFLNLRKRWRTGDRISRAIIAFFVVLGIAATQLPYHIATPLAAAAVFPSIAWIVAVTLVVVRSGYTPAKVFLLAWGMFLLGTAVYVALAFGLLPKTFLTEYGVQIGSALEMLLLSVALGYRYAALRNENERIVRSAKNELEQKVELRTAELRQTMAQLESAHQRLHEFSRHDGLTDLYNRTHFREAFEHLLSQARNSRRPISLLMIDLDHFKRINDAYGHLVGDDCLRLTSNTMAETLQPYDALLARFGGEEFIAALPGMGLEQASAVAEELRQALRAQPCRSGELEISVSASIGVHCVDLEARNSLESALQVADQALYAAKAEGRDCVRTL
ncbi:diguanylate cyclase [Pseudoxanthomonas putridarboris]|uniref:diguanylate cyclase n=1 Tax=Pseudoxanthomonas putridarboris TaxID=752605 RepID=A0ABU9J197_9GAMM